MAMTPTLTVTAPNGDTLNLIRPIVTNDGKLYYFIDKNNNGIPEGGGADDFTHLYWNTVFNGGVGTIDTQPTGAANGLDDQRTFVSGPYTIVLPTLQELLSLYNDTSIPNPPTGYPVGTYWSSTPLGSQFQTLNLATGSTMTYPVNMTQATVVQVIPTVVQNTSNQHYYEFDAGIITFNDAEYEALRKSFRGLYGYLVTVTDLQENEFLLSFLPPAGSGYQNGAGGDRFKVEGGYYWIGASDRGNNGIFKWVGGPESGLALDTTYQNWANKPFPGGVHNEPNSRVGTDFVAMDRYWNYEWTNIENDAGSYNSMIRGYIVEYGGLPATYIITPSATSVNEGSSVTFTIDTKNVEWGKTIAYTLSGVSAADVESGSLTGTAVVSQKGVDGVATVSVALKADQLTEGTESLVLTVGSTSSAVSVLDYSQPNPSYNSATGHYYQAVVTQTSVIQNVLTAGTWDQAKAAAELKSYRGLYGYLVTITSESENTTATAVSVASMQQGWYYTGGSDRASEGTFRWETGPEKGQTLSYTNWWNLPIGSGPEPTSPRLNPNNVDEDAIVVDTGSTSGSYGGYPFTAWTGKWWDVADGLLSLNFTFGEIYKGYIVEYGGLPATYTITPSATSVNEGSSVTFTIDTKNVEWGKTIAYTISGVSAADVESGSLTGTAVVSQKGVDGVATISVGIKSDSLVEGTEALILSVGSSSSAVAVIDVLPQPTVRIDSSSTSVDEGSSVLFTWVTTGVAAGTLYSYTLSGISTADLATGSLTGSVAVGSIGIATLDVQLKADRVTEGTETLQLSSAGLLKYVSVIDTSKYTQLTATATAAPGEIVEIGLHDPILQVFIEDWTKLTAASLEKFNVNGRGRGDNVIRAINVMTILDDPSDGRQIDSKRLGFWIEQIEEGVLAKGDAIMHDIVSGFVYGRDFSELAMTRMDTNGDGVADISYTRAAVQMLYRNVLGRSWSDIVNDSGANWLASEIEANRRTIVDVAEQICFGAEAINSAVSIVGTQNLTFVAFGDGFGG